MHPPATPSHSRMDFLADKTGMSKRSAISAVKELEENDIIDKEEVILKDATGIRKVNRARILYFDGYAQELKDNPDHPKHKFIALRAEQSEREELRSEASIDRGEDDAEGVETVAPKQEYKESLENPTVSDGLGTNEESEKRGDSLIDERQESWQSDKDSPLYKDMKNIAEREKKGELKFHTHEEVFGEDKDSPREKDFVPNTEIGKANDMVEKLTQAKSMNASEKDDSVESLVLSFNDAFGYETPVVHRLETCESRI